MGTVNEMKERHRKKEGRTTGEQAKGRRGKRSRVECFGEQEKVARDEKKIEKEHHIIPQ